jgi:dolichyl-diphosphooligosaccharide--protein glycosyltransferase
MPPPLISLLAAALAKITPFSLNWIGCLLPPLLGLSLAWPLYLISRLYGGRLMVLVSVGLGLFSRYYVYRSHLGWFDTDCLNVTFVFLICYFFMRFGITPQRNKYYYLLAGLGCFVLFLLWWDQTPALVTLISLSPLAIVLILYYRPKGHERWVALGLGILGLVVLGAWQGPEIFITPFKAALQQWGYIAKQQSGDFPNVGVSVLEQKQLSLSALVGNTTGHWATFLAGLAGLGMLIWDKKKQAAALLVPFALGALSFFFARRFMIFFNPFLAIGIGYAAQQLWVRRDKWPPLKFVVPVLIAMIVIVPLKDSSTKQYWPKELPPIVEGMARLGRETSKGAVVWAWWDHGYPMVYWSQRGTINDGSLHGGLRTVINAIPLAEPNPRLAANFIHFYIARGMAGFEKVFAAVGRADRGMQFIRTVLGHPPEQADAVIQAAGLAPAAEWRDFFFPANQREIYLFLDLRLARTTYWWTWFGTWDVARREGSHAVYRMFTNCRRQGDSLQGKEFLVDLVQGQAVYRGKTYALKEAHLISETAAEVKQYSQPNGLVLIYQAKSHTANLLQQPFEKTLFSKLYLLNEPLPDFFSLQIQRFPYYQIWKVHQP